jgi:hypothetical protein
MADGTLVLFGASKMTTNKKIIDAKLMNKSHSEKDAVGKVQSTASEWSCLEENLSVDVKEIRLLHNGKPLRGFADVQIGQVLIRDFRIIQDQGKRAYVVAPQVSWRASTGAVLFKTLVTLSGSIIGKGRSGVFETLIIISEKLNHFLGTRTSSLYNTQSLMILCKTSKNKNLAPNPRVTC